LQRAKRSRFGVPQVRRRVIVVGSLIKARRPWSPPVPCLAPASYITVREAISDLPVLRAGASADYLPYRHSARLSKYQRSMRAAAQECVQGNLMTSNNAMVIERYKHIKPGKNWESIPLELMGNYADFSRCHTGIYHRLRWNLPSKVIGNYRKNMLIHPSQHRGLSVREAARLQSFPDNYVFLGSIGFQQQQVGDAMPPLLAAAVARSLLEARPEAGHAPSKNGRSDRDACRISVPAR
jgi:DNA (cytosine-5)-methyltransferase 1